MKSRRYNISTLLPSVVIVCPVQKIMSTSRRGRHAERSPEEESAPTVVENVDGIDDVVPPVSDDEDWEPLRNIEQGSPPSVATAAPTTTTGNTLFVCVLKPGSHEVILLHYICLY